MRALPIMDGQSRLLFGALLLLFLAMASGRLVSTDEVAVAQVGLALTTFHWGALPVTKYAIGMSLLEAPFLWLGTQLSRLSPSHEQAIALGILSLLPALMGALLGVVTWQLSKALGHDARKSALVVIAAILGSPIFVYTTRFFTELPQAVALVLAVLFALRSNALASGIALAALLVLKPASAAIAAPFLTAFFWTNPQTRRALLRLVAPLLLGLVVVLLHNQSRYGSPLEFGYSEQRDQEYGFHGSLWTGLFGLTLSSGGGLLVFMPICVPALIGLARLGQRLPRVRPLLWGIPIAFLLFHAKWWSWHGGWAWGPRFLIPVVPLIALGLGELKLESRLRPRALTATLVLSILIQIPGLAVSAGDYASTLFHACSEHFPMWTNGSNGSQSGPVDDQINLHFIPDFTPPVGHTWVAVSRLLGPIYAAPWDSQRLCSPIRVPMVPLEWWWARTGGIAPLLAAILLGSAVFLLVRWHRRISVSP